MATISLTIPDAQLTRVIEALCANEPANPLPPTPANARGVLVAWVKEQVRLHEKRVALAALPDPDTGNIVA